MMRSSSNWFRNMGPRVLLTSSCGPGVLTSENCSEQGLSLEAVVDSDARTVGDASVAHRSRSVEPRSCLRTTIVSVAARDEHPAGRQRRHGRELPGEFVGP